MPPPQDNFESVLDASKWAQDIFWIRSCPFSLRDIIRVLEKTHTFFETNCDTNTAVVSYFRDGIPSLTINILPKLY